MKTTNPRAALRARIPAMRVGMSALAISLAVAAGTIAEPVYAQEVPVQINIPAQPLSKALLQLGEQASLQIFFSQGIVEGYTAPAVSGSLPPEEALRRLLAGTGIEFRRTGKNVSLSRPASGDATQLTPVVVIGSGVPSTEGTGSYTSSVPLTTATPLGLTLKETPQSVSVMTSQRMEDQGLTTIQQTLAQVPGIKTGSLGTELGNASSRGYAITNYQYDGVNTFVEVLGGGAVPSATTADMAIYDRVEVLRGASGLVTGAGDPSGTINMVRKKPTAEFQSSVEAGIGSWRDKRLVIDLSGSLNEARSVRGRLIAVGQDADSYIDNYSRKKGLVYGVIEADLTSTTRLTAGVEYERTKVKGQGAFVGFPLWYSDGTRTDLPVSFTVASRDNWLNLESTKVFGTLEQQLANDWTLKLSANHGRSSHRDGRVYLASNNGFADSAGDGLRFNATQRIGHIEQNTVDLNLRGPLTLFGRQHELVIGAAFEDYEQPINRHDDTSGLHGTAANLFSWDRTGAGVYGSTPAVISGYTMKQKSLYGAARLQISDKLKLIAGARVFWQDYDFAETWNGGSYAYASSEDGVFTPYGGVIYDINKNHSAYASYTTIYKAQTTRDRNGAVLDPREGANYEVGLKSEWLDGRLNTSVAFYQIRQDNLSEADPGYMVPGTDSAAYRTVKGAKTTGVDVEISGPLSPGWNVSASWTYGQTKNAAGERITTTFPRHMVKLWTTYRLPGALYRLTIGGGVNWQSKTYSTVNAWQIGKDLYWEQKSFAVVGLMARYEFSDKLSATLNVNNLFDKKYISSVSDWWYSGNYGAPRSAFLNVKYQF